MHMWSSELIDANVQLNEVNGAADGNRTHDLRLTKASLYPLATAAVCRDA